MSHYRVAIVIWLLAIAAAGWRLAWRTTDADQLAGVVIVTLDTTRADRLSTYGFMGVEMPHLERLAAEGVQFETALAVAPLTLPSHASIFTGLFPPRHGVRDNADRPLASSHLTLAEVLRGRGFRTGAFVGSVVLQADRGLAQGFDTYGDVPVVAGPPLASRQRPGAQVMDQALAWLESNAAAPFLLWAHLYDPHAPYDPPAPYRDAHLDPYVGELAYVDAQLGRLLAALDRLHLTDRTLLVVVGDHGEGLGDHGEPTHGQTLYDSVLRIPLIIRAPAVAPRRVDAVVRQVDLMPTLLDLVGLPSVATDGVSLRGALGGAPLQLEAYAESLYTTRLGLAPRHALRDGRFKLIDGPSTELYDLERDPFEQHNIAPERRRVSELMRARLTELSGPTGLAAFERAPISRELRERLMALGYFTDGASAASR